MVMTHETRNEVDEFYKLFGEIVDDVTVTQYNERGGNLEDLDTLNKKKLENYYKNHKLPTNTPYIVGLEGDTYISEGRKPCEQLFQRLMVTYDGSVGMSVGLGAQHSIGYVSSEAFEVDKITNDLEKNKNNEKRF